MRGFLRPRLRVAAAMRAAGALALALAFAGSPAPAQTPRPGPTQAPTPGPARAPTPGPAAPIASAAGTWSSVITAPSGRVDLTFQLAQEGDRVHGTYDYRGPVLVALNVRVTGALRGSALTLFQEGGAAPILEGRLEGRALTGVFRGASAPLPFDAVRVDPD